jgi:hypothetical protein
VLLATVLHEGDPSASQIAIAYVGLGETAEAFKWLERAVEIRMGSFNEVTADPIFDPLRSHPRYGDLMQMMRFPE